MAVGSSPEKDLKEQGSVTLAGDGGPCALLARPPHLPAPRIGEQQGGLGPSRGHNSEAHGHPTHMLSSYYEQSAKLSHQRNAS